MTSQQQTRKRTPLWFGGVASATAACCTHPLDLLKVRLQTSQQQRTSLLRTLVQIIRQESVLALFNGISASLLRQLTYSTVRFGGYEFLKRQLTNEGQQPLTITKGLMAGMLAGGLGGIVGNPADVTNVRMQNDGKLPPEQRRNYKHALDGMLRIAREEGVSKLFVGVSANVARAMLMSSSQLVSYDKSKALLLGTGKFRDDIRTHFCASVMAGLVATTLSSPVDVVKTRLMSATSSGAIYSGMSDAFIKILRTEGPTALFKGWVPAFTRLGPQTVLTFIILEKMKAFYSARLTL